METGISETAGVIQREREKSLGNTSDFVTKETTKEYNGTQAVSSESLSFVNE
jgi:hypothetical protein